MNGKTFSIRKICISAILMALSIVIGIFCKRYFTFSLYYRITFENFPIIMTGICFGPFYSIIAAVGADLLSCVISGSGLPIPLVSCGAAAVGALSGFVPIFFKKFFPKAKSDTVIAFTVGISHLFGQVIIKSVGKMLPPLYMPKIGILIGLAVSCIVGTVEFFFIKTLLGRNDIKELLLQNKR